MVDWSLERLLSEVRVESLRYLHVITGQVPHCAASCPNRNDRHLLAGGNALENDFPKSRRTAGG